MQDILEVVRCLKVWHGAAVEFVLLDLLLVSATLLNQLLLLFCQLPILLLQLFVPLITPQTLKRESLTVNFHDTAS